MQTRGYRDVFVPWALAGGSEASKDIATADGAHNGTVKFEDGERDATITLHIKPDDHPEIPEVFTIAMYSYDLIRIPAFEAGHTMQYAWRTLLGDLMQSFCASNSK